MKKKITNHGSTIKKKQKQNKKKKKKKITNHGSTIKKKQTNQANQICQEKLPKSIRYQIPV